MYLYKGAKIHIWTKDGKCLMAITNNHSNLSQVLESETLGGEPKEQYILLTDIKHPEMGVNLKYEVK